MKKILFIIFTFLLFPISIFAQTYEVSNIGITLSFDDQKWDVVTTESDSNNSLLTKYEISYESIQSYLKENSMYVYAVYDGNEQFEFAIRNHTNSVSYNDYSIEDLASAIANKKGLNDYKIYENGYKYIKFEYYEPISELYIIDYYIMINYQQYVFTAQKSTEFLEEEKLEIQKVMDSVSFEEKSTETSTFKINWIEAISSGISCMIGAGIMSFIFNKLNIKKQNVK
jgi:hypothetical protein